MSSFHLSEGCSWHFGELNVNTTVEHRATSNEKVLSRHPSPHRRRQVGLNDVCTKLPCKVTSKTAWGALHALAFGNRATCCQWDRSRPLGGDVSSLRGNWLRHSRPPPACSGGEIDAFRSSERRGQVVSSRTQG